MLQTGINDIKRILSNCKSIKTSISDLTSKNISELTSSTKLISAVEDELPRSEETEQLMNELIEGLKSLSRSANN